MLLKPDGPERQPGTFPDVTSQDAQRTSFGAQCSQQSLSARRPFRVFSKFLLLWRQEPQADFADRGLARQPG